MKNSAWCCNLVPSLREVCVIACAVDGTRKWGHPPTRAGMSAVDIAMLRVQQAKCFLESQTLFQKCRHKLYIIP